jgi:spore coat polysaccharide biosynthesis predicted glycosyltransferase SpsG
MKILILADGNHKIGMGHIYRSVSLSQELKNYGHEIAFITKDTIAKKFFSKISECVIIPNLNSPKIDLFLKKFSPELILLDKLKESKIVLKNLRKFCPILAIDYTGKHYDLIDHGINILYHETGIKKNSFSSFKYTILNKNFKKNKNRKLNKEIKSVIILQGGSDTYCFTPKILKSILLVKNNFSISIVLGPSFKCHKKLNQIIKESNKTIKIFHDVKNMSNLMQKHDLAITAGGNTLVELAYLGIPSIIICGEKFELETAKLITKNGFGINVGFGGSITSSKIQLNLEKLINNFTLRKKMSKMGHKLIDGNGNHRIRKIIESLTL